MSKTIGIVGNNLLHSSKYSSKTELNNSMSKSYASQIISIKCETTTFQVQSIGLVKFTNFQPFNSSPFLSAFGNVSFGSKGNASFVLYNVCATRHSWNVSTNEYICLRLKFSRLPQHCKCSRFPSTRLASPQLNYMAKILGKLTLN